MRAWVFALACALIAGGCNRSKPTPIVFVEPKAPAPTVVPSALEGSWTGDRGSAIVFLPGQRLSYKPQTSDFALQGEYRLKGYELEASVGYGWQPLGKVGIESSQKFKLFATSSDYEEFTRSTGNRGGTP